MSPLRAWLKTAQQFNVGFAEAADTASAKQIVTIPASFNNLRRLRGRF